MQSPYPYRKPLEHIIQFANADLSDADSIARLNPEPYIDHPIHLAPRVIAAFPSPPTCLDKRTKRSQKRLRDLLDKLTKRRPRIREVQSYIDHVLPKAIGLQAGVYLRSKERDERFYWFKLTAQNIPQWFCFGLNMLIEDGLADRIGRCALDECDRYFVAWPGKRGRAGKAQRYCCRRHGSIAKSRNHRRKRRIRGIGT